MGEVGTVSYTGSNGLQVWADSKNEDTQVCYDDSLSSNANRGQ